MAEGEEAFEHVRELSPGVGFAHVGQFAVFVEEEAVVAFDGHAVPITERVLDFAVLAEDVVTIVQCIAHATVAPALAAEVQGQFQADAYRPLVRNLVHRDARKTRRDAHVVVGPGCLVRRLDVFVREEFLAYIDADFQVDVLENFGNPVFECARHECRGEIFRVLVRVVQVFIVEGEEMHAVAAEHPDVEVSGDIKAETGKERRCVGEEAELAVLLGPFLLVAVVGIGISRFLVDGAELDAVDFQAEPDSERNVCLGKWGNQGAPQVTHG